MGSPSVKLGLKEDGVDRIQRVRPPALVVTGQGLAQLFFEGGGGGWCTPHLLPLIVRVRECPDLRRGEAVRPFRGRRWTYR